MVVHPLLIGAGLSGVAYVVNSEIYPMRVRAAARSDGMPSLYPADYLIRLHLEACVGAALRTREESPT